MDPQMIYIILFGALGLFFGSMRSRSIQSDLFVLGIWAIFFIINPTVAMGCAIGGYLVGWGFRCLRDRNAGSKGDDDLGQGGDQS